MQDWVAPLTVAEVVETLSANGIPCGPVYSPRQLLDDPLVQESGVFTPVAVPGVDTAAPLVRPIVEFPGSDVAIRTGAPEVGAQTLQILADLGLAADQIAQLTSAGIAASAA
jgi:crotonobetainyl-CoA:carnitine CoA-transferase CaiB-like acyl-CoA transferase